MSFLLVAYFWYSHAQKCGAYGALHELMIYFEICSLCFVCLSCLLCLPNVCWHQMQDSVAREHSGECYSCNPKAATSPWTDCFCLSMGKIVSLLCERACLATLIRQISAMSHANAVILSWQCLCLCRCDSVSVMTCCCHADQTLCSAWLYNLLCLEKLPVSKETWRRWSWRCSFTGNHTLGVPNLTTWDLTWPYCMWHCSDSNKKKGSQAGGAFYAWKSIRPWGIEFGNLEGPKSTKIGHVQKMDPRTPLDLSESSKE